MTRQVRLESFALARSGDKGAHANVGVWVRSDEAYEVIKGRLTADDVARHFAEVCRGGVTRFELPKLRALNFLLHDALDGGGTESLRSDAQGKVLSMGLLEILVDVPDEFES
jgi:hypothetical protein